MKRVLFVCVHNSARSQMAEAFLNDIGRDMFTAESAGLEAGVLNPVVVDAMKEIGYDISANKTKNVFDFFKQGKSYDFVVTVCDEANGERCPIFPGGVKRLHWGFEDPSSFSGDYEEKLARTRIVRDAIKEKIADFINSFDE